jgi:hypothetical protein
MLATLGLEIEPFGAGAILVRALPAALRHPDAAGLLRDLADELAEDAAPRALEARLDAALARLACHRSIRAGRRLAPAEMAALLRAMEATPRAATAVQQLARLAPVVGRERTYGGRRASGDDRVGGGVGHGTGDAGAGGALDLLCGDDTAAGDLSR